MKLHKFDELDSLMSGIRSSLFLVEICFLEYLITLNV